MAAFFPAYASSASEAPTVSKPATLDGLVPEDQWVPALGNGAVEADAEFSNLFADWKALDNKSHGKVAIPSGKPVENYKLTSEYGYREDPFQGRRARHKGIDMAGPIGTPIYATADGVVGRAQWLGGYGRYVEINHGGNMQTRYGHLSEMNVVSNQAVKKGEIIGYMGSTGRSTGSHLHYEVRIAGEAVNPTPFLQANSYMAAMQDRANIGLGGPEE